MKAHNSRDTLKETFALCGELTSEPFGLQSLDLVIAVHSVPPDNREIRIERLRSLD
jgi:hypothetical protein